MANIPTLTCLLLCAIVSAVIEAHGGSGQKDSHSGEGQKKGVSVSIKPKKSGSHGSGSGQRHHGDSGSGQKHGHKGKKGRKCRDGSSESREIIPIPLCGTVQCKPCFHCTNNQCVPNITCAACTRLELKYGQCQCTPDCRLFQATGTPCAATCAACQHCDQISGNCTRDAVPVVEFDICPATTPQTCQAECCEGCHDCVLDNNGQRACIPRKCPLTCQQCIIGPDGKPMCTSSALDIIYLIDGSGSIGSDNFPKETNFVKMSIQSLDFTAGTQTGVVQFDDTVIPEWHLNTYKTKEENVAAVDSQIVYSGGQTKIGQALQESQTEFDNPAFGHIATSTKVLILITDGESQDDPQPAALALRNSGVRILVVGVGAGVNDAELTRITGDQPAQYFKAADFDQLTPALKDQVAAELCKLVPAPDKCKYVKCGPCETCNPKTGTCLSSCLPCQKCDATTNKCGDDCPTCKFCDPDSKQCAATRCPDPIGQICSLTSGKCECQGCTTFNPATSKCDAGCLPCQKCNPLANKCEDNCPNCQDCSPISKVCTLAPCPIPDQACDVKTGQCACPKCTILNPLTKKCDAIKCTSPCDVCNKATGKCESTCLPCQRCDSTGKCASFCQTKCHECSATTKQCEPKKCPIPCQKCNLLTGACDVDNCPNCQDCNLVTKACAPTNVKCPIADQTCNPASGNCECPKCTVFNPLTKKCDAIKCPAPCQTCDKSTGKCEQIKCALGCQKCNPKTSLCEAQCQLKCQECKAPNNVCTQVKCPDGKACNLTTGLCPVR